ncbi:MAG: hypothetical protein K8R59_13905 [Thermoanaerobaculales bacterium]|nr:hypothetical protein [Thermoanaerobaculales bacterium]
MISRNPAQVVVVAGDVTIDWNIASISDSGTDRKWSSEGLTRTCFQRGGAAMLGDLITAVLDKDDQSDVELFMPTGPEELARPEDKSYHHSYAQWSRFPGAKGGSELWRVERFLGFDRRHSGSGVNPELSGNPAQADLVILDDADLGFRDTDKAWPAALGSADCGWVLVKISGPAANGPLWEYLIEHHAERLVTIISADDLRRSQVHISRQVSWERTAQDLLWELLYNPRINALTQGAALIVSFQTAGAVLVTRRSDGALEAKLLFDPDCMEGTWAANEPGQMIGYTSCLAASLALQLLQNPQNPDFSRGIQSGVAGMRLLFTGGYKQEDLEEYWKLRFPVAALAAEIIAKADPLETVSIPDPAAWSTDSSAIQWTILDAHRGEWLDRIAKQIVLEGLHVALSRVPVGRYGNLLTVDRSEIEALQSIRSLIREYNERPQERPLSIAVFGPPGAGKSFAVKQVARCVGAASLTSMTFNLSQMEGPEELIDALHQVRDEGLRGRLPLVFWDEFDTPLAQQALGWLRYFLAPMQDGEFQQGQLNHPIGRCIFIFAGGTCESMDHFLSTLDESARKAAKLPDFVSRLRGYLNILGPNPQELSGGDPFYIIRRAILARSMLERGAPQIMTHVRGRKLARIDSGVLHALLSVDRYKHGARSLEAVIGMSHLAGKTSFERSALPTEKQLDLHVDGREFFTQLHQLELDEELLDRCAKAAHEVFCDGLRDLGYSKGESTSEELKTHAHLVSYDELAEEPRAENRANVADIPNKLVLAGYVMTPARGEHSPPTFPDEILERLAEIEHERWVKHKLDREWQFADTTDPSRKLHSGLVPWQELSESEREKDREMVRSIPRILARAGFTIMQAVPESRS